ncbi:hypothetical protein FPV67DRAFT_618422 [Lyophyllum atratum]|nr:hypothetical protein FPV67DRAFT_618422 [Lyophyllum atratum]
MIRKRADTTSSASGNTDDPIQGPKKKCRGEGPPPQPTNHHVRDMLYPFASNLKRHSQDIVELNQLPGLRTALDIQRATELHWRIPEIGICPLREQRPEETIEYYSRQSCETEERHGRDDPARKVPENDRQLVLDFLKIQKQFPAYKDGELDSGFQLSIFLFGYTFNDTVEDPTRRWRTADVSSRLKAWFDHAHISGFGDVRNQVTKVDSKVRMAREIRSDAFNVEPKLLDAISKHWQDHFYPSHVRVEPYKIHLYGPGGHFKAHRDTPQKDLVGTFLVGLGDSTGSKNLIVDGDSFGAHEGSWVAFYPDVPHEVTEIADGYRAVLAFKVFRAPDSSGAEEDVHRATGGIPPILRCATEKLVSSLEAPFGLILDRKYCLGTTALSGMDALVFAYAQIRQDINVQVIPILTTTFTFDNFSQEDARKDCTAQIITTVHPFSSDIIDHILERKKNDTIIKKWKGVQDVLFYHLHNENSSVKWSRSMEEINWTGNEADATRENSLYLSYALVCLPVSLGV